MKILFIVPHTKDYDSSIVRKYPCGGTEKAATFLREALERLGHDIRIVTTWEATQTMDVTWPDAVITQHAEQFERFPTALRRVWWCHQFSDRPFLRQVAYYARRYAHHVVALSKFHQNDLQQNLGFESVVIGYGVWHDEIVIATKDPAQLVYSSVPPRGLEMVPGLFRHIRAEIPEATITVCSSMATWNVPEGDACFQSLFEVLERTEGVQLTGALGQRDLFAQLATATLFFYPCIYRETYCLAMAEAMAHGCVPIVPDIGALPERWPPTAFLAQKAIDEIHRARTRIRKIPKPPDWMEIAEQWDYLLTQ